MGKQTSGVFMTFTACPKCCSQYFKHIFMFSSRLNVVFCPGFHLVKHFLLFEVLWEGFLCEICLWSPSPRCIHDASSEGAEQKHKGDGWLAFVTAKGTRCFWLQLPWPRQMVWESLFSLSPWEGPLKFIAHNVLLAVGRIPGNFRQMKLAMLQWFRLQWPRLQGNTEWNSTLCNMVSRQWHRDHDGNPIKHPWTSHTNQDWYWTG